MVEMFDLLKEGLEDALEYHKKRNKMQKEIEWIPLTKWVDHFHYPTYGSMRNIVNQRKDNGAEYFISMINHRIYINVKKFNEWMEKQKEKR